MQGMTKTGHWFIETKTKHVSDKNTFRMNRVTQFVSFTSIMSVSMVCLAVTLLLLAQGTQHPVAVQVTFYPFSFNHQW